MNSRRPGQERWAELRTMTAPYAAEAAAARKAIMGQHGFDILADHLRRNREALAEQGITPPTHADLYPVKPKTTTKASRDEARRRAQRDENARLQVEAEDTAPQIMSVEDMLADCVWIAEGSQVGRISQPRFVLKYPEFAAMVAASFSIKEVQDEKTGKTTKRKVHHCTDWKDSAERKTVKTRTFKAGAPAICRDPDGLEALNSWRPITRWDPSTDVQPFLDQVAYLFSEEGERAKFLDWLAHIEQRPGVLPHYGWLHVAESTGTGRNWLASLLSRVWIGYVAPNIDLNQLLDGSFNGELAGRVLALVDEVQEGGSENQYRHINRLKSTVNAEKRSINPKFGRAYVEHNACRWLVFSNHKNALPINDTDRRWRVQFHDAPPRSAEDYAKLYALLDDPEFVNAVGVFLSERNIADFNPGERPPMTQAKRTVIDAAKPMILKDAETLVKLWPSDVIANEDVLSVLGEGLAKQITPAMRRALEECGAMSGSKPIKVRGRTAKFWMLRNVERWSAAPGTALALEILRARPGEWKDAETILAEA